MTVAAFMERALYDPKFGYYACTSRRTGRAGDFFTSVDVGPLFGQLLEIQIAELFELLTKDTRDTKDTKEDAQQPAASSEPRAASREQRLDLVEAGASDGRLAADILRAARERHPDFYNRIQLHLVEASAAARAEHRSTLGDLAERLVSSSASLPDTIEGVVIANELLDAMPVHQVVMREDGLREVYVEPAFAPQAVRQGPGLFEGSPSTPALQQYLDRLGVRLEPGWRVEINLRAVDWVRDAARRLRRGFVILIDYGHEARELYSASHAGGTLTTYSAHRSSGAEAAAPPWLQRPGEQDITAHVDFTSVRDAAEAEGMTTIGFLDQTYFLLGLLPALPRPEQVMRTLKPLIMPGGLGSTQKVLILGKGVGTPTLQACSFRVRVT